MFLLTDIKQTRVYQEAKQEGRQEGKHEGKLEGRQEGKQEGEVQLLVRQLSKRFGQIGDRRLQAINNLTIEQLEDLGEALLDFTDSMELDSWLQSRVSNF